MEENYKLGMRWSLYMHHLGKKSRDNEGHSRHESERVVRYS